LTIWWWCVLAMTLALNILFICCIFIVCPHYDASVLGESVSVYIATPKWINLLAAYLASTDRQNPSRCPPARPRVDCPIGKRLAGLEADSYPLVKCSTPSAISKQTNFLRAAAFMDIFTDILGKQSS